MDPESRLSKLEASDAVQNERLNRHDELLSKLNEHLAAVVTRLDRLTIALIVVMLGSEEGVDVLSRIFA